MDELKKLRIYKYNLVLLVYLLAFAIELRYFIVTILITGIIILILVFILSIIIEITLYFKLDKQVRKDFNDEIKFYYLGNYAIILGGFVISGIFLLYNLTIFFHISFIIELVCLLLYNIKILRYSPFRKESL